MTDWYANRMLHANDPDRIDPTEDEHLVAEAIHRMRHSVKYDDEINELIQEHMNDALTETCYEILEENQ